MVFSRSLDKLGILERECRQWANFANFLKVYSRHSPVRAIRVKEFLNLEKAMGMTDSMIDMRFSSCIILVRTMAP
jgi:hypothetical protein